MVGAGAVPVREGAAGGNRVPIGRARVAAAWVEKEDRVGRVMDKDRMDKDRKGSKAADS